MSSNTPAAPGTEAAQAWVLAFAEGWQAPASAEAFADHFQPWFDPQIRLIQPQLPTLVGHQAFRERFAGPLFALIPDLAGRVERFAIGAECAYVELTLRGTLGGRPISWRVCDRATLREGLVVERESYFDPMPLLRAILTRPRALASTFPRMAAIPTSPNPHDGSTRRYHGSTTDPAANHESEKG
jgi:ketosteroid isomerase-like protein